jgi:transposase-like protein
MKWTGEAKLKAVVDTSGLSENEVGAYVRREGLYSNQVSEWRAEIIEHLGTKPSFKKDERDEKIKVLEREILRKDKALAEASALLILQKKVDLIWGDKDVDEK